MTSRVDEFATVIAYVLIEGARFTYLFAGFGNMEADIHGVDF
jgi:hypothetical protein